MHGPDGENAIASGQEDSLDIATLNGRKGSGRNLLLPGKAFKKKPPTLRPGAVAHLLYGNLSG